MEIIRVKEKNAFVPIAVEIDNEPDVDFLNEVLKNTYPGEGYASRRAQHEVGPGGIDCVYGDNWTFDREYIPANQPGWLVLNERHAAFYPHETLWNDYDRMA